MRGWLARDFSALSQVACGGAYDILVFTETWLAEGAEVPEMPGFVAVSAVARPAGRGSPRGGIVCMYVCMYYILCMQVKMTYDTGSNGTGACSSGRGSKAQNKQNHKQNQATPHPTGLKATQAR